MRADQTLNNNHSLFQRFMYYKGSQLQPAAFTSTDMPQRGRNLAVGHTWVISSSWVNELRFGYNYAYHLNAPISPEGRNWTADLGLRNLAAATFPLAYGRPGLAISGFSGQGEGGNTQGATENIYSVSNATSKTFGGHTLRFGLQAQFRKFDHLTDNSTRGNFTFNGNFTGNSVGDFLLGYCSTCAGAFGASRATYHSPTIAPFIDDNWQVNNKLSLQLGLRWEYLAPWAEENGIEAAFDAATGKIGYNALPTSMPAALVPLVHQQEHYFPDGILQKDLNNFGPRIGMAYNLTDRMVLRSGFGVYYDNLNLNELQFTRLIPPYYGQYSLNPAVSAPLQVDTLFPDLNNIPQFPAPFSLDPSNRSPYTMQWNVNFQRSLGPTTWLRPLTPAAGAGTCTSATTSTRQTSERRRSTRVSRSRSSNRRCSTRRRRAGPTSRACRCGSRSAIPPGCSSSPITSCRRTATTGRERSRRMTRPSGPTSTPTPACRAITSAIAAPSASATSCRLAKAAAGCTAAVPLAYVLGGWQVQGVVRAGSGFPFTLSGTNVCQCGSFVPQRVNLVAGRDDRGVLDNPTQTQWYDKTAYVLPGGGIPGHGWTQHLDWAGLEAGGFLGEQALPDGRGAPRVPRRDLQSVQQHELRTAGRQHQQRHGRRHLHRRRCAEHAVRHPRRMVTMGSSL